MIFMRTPAEVHRRHQIVQILIKNIIISLTPRLESSQTCVISSLARFIIYLTQFDRFVGRIVDKFKYIYFLMSPRGWNKLYNSCNDLLNKKIYLFWHKGRRQKKKIADFQTFAQIGVGGSGKNLIQKINLIGTKY